jgi:hypothetical protein
VNVAVYPRKCPHCDGIDAQGLDRIADGTAHFAPLVGVNGVNPYDVAVCSVCGNQVGRNGTRRVYNDQLGTMMHIDDFPGPGRTTPIYRCRICGARYCSDPGFGAQDDSPFCGTAGNFWK